MTSRLRALTAAGAVLLAASAAQAQDATRIVAATLYPDGARVERELKVPGGTRHVTLACLPASVDLGTLQVDGDPALRMGEVRAAPLPASRSTECTPSPVEAQKQALDTRRAALEAQRDANELALGYLRGWGNAAPADTAAGPLPVHKTASPATAVRPGAQAGELRQAALDLLTDQARVRRELDALAREADRLADALPPTRGKAGWRTVRFDVWTPAAATLHVRYNVAGASWRPSYRATMDAAAGTLRLDRQADIVQGSGEDWSDVRLTLWTGRVNRAGQGPTPAPWFVDIAAPVLSFNTPAPVFAASVPSPAPLAEMRRSATSAMDVADKAPPPPDWSASMATGERATSFVLAQPATLASDGEVHTLQLASQSLPATLKRRATPRTDRAVYLLADAARPDGVWPAGPLQAWMDGALVARTFWQPAGGDRLEIALGQDDRMRVDVESPGGFTQSRGVFGGSVERTSTAVYAIVNQRAEPVVVQVLDAAPVSRNEAVKITHAWSPQPATTDWDKRPGVAEWTLSIMGQGTSRVSVSHTVVAPRDAAVTNLP